MKKRLLVLLTTVVMMLVLVACGSKITTLEDYYMRPAYKAALEQEMENVKTQYADAYSDIAFEVKGNTFSYIYTYAVQIEDVDTAKATLAASFTDETMAPLAESLEQEAGVKGITVEYTFLNNDGSNIYTASYTTAAE